MERLVWLLVLCVVTRAAWSKAFDNDEAKVYRDLMTHYDAWNPDRNVRPVGEDGTVTITYGQTLHQLLAIDDNNIATLVLWDSLVWTDAALKWSTASGVPSLRVDPAKIWMPDIKLYNKVDPSPESIEDVQAVVTPDGQVLYVPPVIRKVQCVPEDGMLKCPQKLGSWVYDAGMIDLQLASDQMDVTSYVENDDWKLVTTSATRNAQKYDCCPEVYVDLTYNAYFKKRN